jgi:hypothetical protein
MPFRILIMLPRVDRFSFMSRDDTASTSRLRFLK